MSWLAHSTPDHPFDDIRHSPVPYRRPLAVAAEAILRAVRPLHERTALLGTPAVVRVKGWPGSGRTAAVRRVARCLRVLDHTTIGEIGAIQRVAGYDRDRQLIDVPLLGEAPRAYPRETHCWVPFRCPHHTVSEQGIRGQDWAPGELHLAHGGILVLDQTHEFMRSTQEAVTACLAAHRLECHAVVFPTLRKRSGDWAFPARFTLITTENPCPCGYAATSRAHANAIGRACSCSPDTIDRFRRRNLIAQAFPDAPVIDLCALLVDAGPEANAAEAAPTEASGEAP
jgi:magnesium chelatase family protein